jgi:hypothetical protein
MKNWIDRNLSMVLTIGWFILIITIAALLSGCQVDNSNYQEVHMKFPIDSVQKIEPVSTLEFEPKYKVYFNNGQYVFTKNYRWASTTDSLEVIYIKKIK